MPATLTELILDRAHNSVISIDERGLVTYWNPRAEITFGYSREEAVGRPVSELIVPARFRDAHRAGLERFLAEGSGPILDRRVELTALRRDGSEFPVEMTISALPDGSQWTFHAFVADISWRKDAEREHQRLFQELRRALHGSELRFDAIVGALSDPVTIRDREHRFVYANQAAVVQMGFDSWEEMRRTPPAEVMAQYDVRDENGREVSMDDIPSVRILRGESAEPLLIQTVHRGSGIRRWNLLKSAPLLDEAGEVEATITIIEDVTDQHRAERHAAFLAEVSEVLASSLDYEQTLRNVAALAVPTIVDWCAVDLLEEGGERKPVAVAHVDPARIRLAEELRRYEPGQLDPDQGLGLVFRTGTSVLYERVDDEMLVAAAIDVRHLELLRAIGFRSVAIVPMRLGRRVLGAMTLVTAESARALDRSDLELAEQVAARAAVAIENSRLYSERSMIAHTLQQSLLPERLPEIAGYELASLYIPAGRSSDVGGDFYDVWQAKRSWLIVIGDVTGKGVQAATLTSLVRHTIRTASEFVSSPAALLALVDKTLKQQQHRSLCTALCIRLDGDQAAIAAGGHPLPLHISASGVMQAGAHGPILGAFEDASWRDSRLQLEPDSTLVTYTDGVTDAVGEDGTRYGLERLRTLLARSRNHSADEVIRALREALDSFQTGAHADDTAALVLHRPSSAAEISGSGEAASDRSAAAV